MSRAEGAEKTDLARRAPSAIFARNWYSPRSVRGSLRFLTVVATALAAAAIVPRAQQPEFDLLIRNGRVIDGTGSPWYRADVALRGDTIARIAYRIDAPAVRTIDAGGQ